MRIGLLLLFIGLNAAMTQTAEAQPSQTLSIPPDSPRWELQGQAKAVEYQGRKCLYVGGGAATVKDLEMRDGVIDVDSSAQVRLARCDAVHAGAQHRA